MLNLYSFSSRNMDTAQGCGHGLPSIAMDANDAAKYPYSSDVSEPSQVQVFMTHDHDKMHFRPEFTSSYYDKQL